MSPTDPESLDVFVTRALHAAGRVALSYFRRPLVVDDKAEPGAFDPVTEADRAVEQALRDRLAERFPDDPVTGEEQGEASASAVARQPFRWLIDPIDGTRAFITGVPSWGILLGLLEAGRPKLGWMYQPHVGELFGGDGRSAWLEHAGTRRALRVSPAASLAVASLYSTHPEQFAEAADHAAFMRLAARCRLNRFGGDCYSYCMLAAGCIDLVVETGLQAYDILPLVPIIEGAGGTVTDWDGNALRGGGRIVAAASPALHAAALEVLAS